MGTGKTIILIDGEAPPPLIPSKRFTLALLVFFAFIVQYSQRVNLPIAIVCMVNRTRVIEHSNITQGRIHPSTAIQKVGTLNEKQFNWIELQQQILLGGYWAGYIFTQVPGGKWISDRSIDDHCSRLGGWLATTIGAKWVYAGSLFTSSIATLVSTAMYFMPSTHF